MPSLASTILSIESNTWQLTLVFLDMWLSTKQKVSSHTWKVTSTQTPRNVFQCHKAVIAQQTYVCQSTLSNALNKVISSLFSIHLGPLRSLLKNGKRIAQLAQTNATCYQTERSESCFSQAWHSQVFTDGYEWWVWFVSQTPHSTSLGSKGSKYSHNP